MLSNAKEPEWIDESGEDYTLKLARIKFQAISNHLKENDILVTSDTTVIVDDEIINKPTNKDHAYKMIEKLSDKDHQVCTSYVVVNKKQEVFNQSVISTVRCHSLSPEEINNYLNQNEYQDKAGAYGIQGAAQTFIEKIDGSYSNIVGFPIDHLVEYFRKTYGNQWRERFE